MSEPAARPSSAGRGRSDGAGKGGGRAGRGRIAGVRRPSLAAARDEENGSDNDEPSPALARPTVARPPVASAPPKTLLAARAAAEKAATDSAAKPAAARPKSLVARRTSTASRPLPDLSMVEEADEAAAAEPPPPPLASSSRAPLLSPGTSGGGRSPASSSGALQVKALAGRLFPSEKEAEVDDLVMARLPKVLRRTSRGRGRRSAASLPCSLVALWGPANLCYNPTNAAQLFPHAPTVRHCA